MSDKEVILITHQLGREFMEATYEIQSRVMLDPSLLAARNTVDRTLGKVEDNRAGLQFHLPQTFHEHLTETDWYDGKPVTSELPPVLRYYVSHRNPPNLHQ